MGARTVRGSQLRENLKGATPQNGCAKRADCRRNFKNKLKSRAVSGEMGAVGRGSPSGSCSREHGKVIYRQDEENGEKRGLIRETARQGASSPEANIHHGLGGAKEHNRQIHKRGGLAVLTWMSGSVVLKTLIFKV